MAVFARLHVAKSLFDNEATATETHKVSQISTLLNAFCRSYVEEKRAHGTAECSEIRHLVILLCSYQSFTSSFASIRYFCLSLVAIIFRVMKICLSVCLSPPFSLCVCACVCVWHPLFANEVSLSNSRDDTARWQYITLCSWHTCGKLAPETRASNPALETRKCDMLSSAGFYLARESSAI